MESEQRWRRLEAQIICPLKPDSLCRKNEGIKRDEKLLSHSAKVITAECNSCGKKASGWGSQ